MRWSRLTMVAAPFLFTLMAAAPAAAQEPRGFVRELLVMWLPLIVIIGVWIFFIRKAGAGGKQAKMIERQIAMIDRYIPHMDALEQKLDRIIDLLDRQSQK